MISVLIATRDRARLLAGALEALAAQRWPGEPFEVVVVDNGSVDSTDAVVAAYAQRSAAPVVRLYEPRPGKSHALNTALRHARGEVLVLTDDDVLPSAGWLAAYVKAFAESGADYVVGRILPLWDAPPPAWLTPPLYGVLAVPDGGGRRLRLTRGCNDDIMPLGGNMAVRRHVVDRIGGWNPDLGKLQGTLRMGEDHEFGLKMLRAGFVGLYEPAATVHHHVPQARLRRSYFRAWFYENGLIEAALERDFPTTTRYVLSVPRHLWRELARDVVSTARARLTWNAARATAAEMRLLWFAGYIRGSWRRRQAAFDTTSQSAAIDRS